MESLLEWLSTALAGNRNDVLFGVFSFLGANFHFVQGRLRKTVSDTWLEYWFISNRLNSAGAIGALIAADVLFMGSNSLANATLLLIVGSAWAIGYGLDAAINKGTPGTGSVAEVVKAVGAGKIDDSGNKQNGFARAWFLMAVFTVTFAGCAFLGLTQPKTAGQSITQAFGVVLAVETIIPNLIDGDAVISPTQARNTNNTAHAVAKSIETYWVTYGVFSQCQKDALTASAKLAEDGSVSPAADTPACAGPDPAKVLIAISTSLAQLQSFLVTYQNRTGAH